MAQLDAFNFANAIRDRLVDFSLDRNFVRDSALTGICRRLWQGRAQDGGLVSELWVEGAFPAELSEQSLDSLVKQGKFNATLAGYLNHDKAVPSKRQLYTHQRAAILRAQEHRADGARPALVVTAGTGAGKTESFLLPILNELFSRPVTGKGVKCIILYPMNALVNDQVDRLYDWLKEQRDMTLFHFTSETPEDGKRADNEGISWEPCRMRTRKEARGQEAHDGKSLQPNDQRFGRVPDILITNYSMLEYMLCRPQDAVFFGDGLSALVLDEAHLYTGTLAAEITLLLRRLTERCGVPPERLLHIATSATIGREGPEGDKELKDFASMLFSKSPELIEVIRGQSRRIEMKPEAPPLEAPTFRTMTERAWLNSPTLTMDYEGKPQLSVDPETCSRLAEQLSLLVNEATVGMACQQSADQPARLLHNLLASAPLVHRVSDILWKKKRLLLGELAKDLWSAQNEETVRATIALLQMGAAARQSANELPLVPHRLHLLARPTDGLVVCLNADCTGAAELKLSGLGCVMAGFSDHCPHCDSVTLSLYRCANCGETALAAKENNLRLWPAPNYEHSKKSFFTWRACSSAADEKRVIGVDIRTGQQRGNGAEGLSLSQLTDCPQCETPPNDAWRPFVASASLTLAVLAETALTEMPEYPAAHRNWLPARGRRLLAFSDSRQEAARLGPRLTLQHETQLIRAALVRCAESDGPADEATIADIQSEIAGQERLLDQPDRTPAQRQRVQAKLNELRRELQEHQVGGALTEWQLKIKEESILHEVIDPDTASKHEEKDWPDKAQERWDENKNAVAQRLLSLLGRELASPLRRAISVETLGLLEVTYPGLEQVKLPNELLGRLPALVRENLAACWPDFLAALCDSLRSDGAITLGTDDADKEWFFNRVFTGRWCAEETARRWVIRFVGETPKQRRRWFATEILKNCGLEDEVQREEYALELLHAAFAVLQRNAGKPLVWLQTDDRQIDSGSVPAIRLKFPELGLRRPAKLFQSARTQHIWPRTVLGCAPELGCNDLREITPDELNHDARYGRQRQELQGLKRPLIFQLALWAEEHSAQLDPKRNRQLQDLFKRGVRNILSATTTLELGIDIGGLNAVLMGNVPPGKANYLQRAGRAGRRADGSSVVLTFARPRPFDRAVFANFGKYLDRELRRPRVLLDRQRIARRHCHAFLLSDFFQSVYPPGAHTGAMQAFGSMGRFCGSALPRKWTGNDDKPELQLPRPDWNPPATTAWWQARSDPGLENHFRDFLLWVRDDGEQQYRMRLENLLRDTPLQMIANWPKWVDDIEAGFQAAVQDWKQDYESLLGTWNETTHHRQANAMRYQLSAFYDTTVIEALADRQFLPRYGFPIGVQKLQVIQPDEGSRDGDRVKIREEDQFRLERPGLLALREYVPGSQLLVGGKLITSRGLRKHWTGAALDNYFGLTGQFAECLNGHLFYELSQQLGCCPICDGNKRSNAQQLLLPKHGFSSAAWDPPRRSTNVERVGSVERATITFGKRAGNADAVEDNFARIAGLTARYREAGELLVYNSGAIWEEDENEVPRMLSRGLGFAVCLKCGYADSEIKNGSGTGKIDLPSGFEKHAPLTVANEKFVCWRDGKAEVLRSRILAARETTDVLMLTFDGQLSALAKAEPLVWTLAHALQIAGARLLELDTRELGVMVTGVGQRAKEWGAVLYDNVPGGAGHVLELLKAERTWLERTQEVLFLSETHHRRCETACLDCLLTFDAQEAMSRGLLKRKEAYEVLSQLLTGNILSLPDTEKPAGGKPLNSAPRLSKDERVKRGQERLGTS